MVTIAHDHTHTPQHMPLKQTMEIGENWPNTDWIYLRDTKDDLHFQNICHALQQPAWHQLTHELAAKFHIEVQVLLLMEMLSLILIVVMERTVTCWFFENGPVLTFLRAGFWSLVISPINRPWDSWPLLLFHLMTSLLSRPSCRLTCVKYHSIPICDFMWPWRFRGWPLSDWLSQWLLTLLWYVLRKLSQQISYTFVHFWSLCLLLANDTRLIH